MADEIMTFKEVCAYLKLPRTTVYKLCQCNNLPYVKAGKQLRFRKLSVDKWLENEEKRKARWISRRRKKHEQQ